MQLFSILGSATLSLISLLCEAADVSLGLDGVCAGLDSSPGDHLAEDSGLGCSVESLVRGLPLGVLAFLREGISLHEGSQGEAAISQTLPGLNPVLQMEHDVRHPLPIH